MTLRNENPDQNLARFFNFKNITAKEVTTDLI